MSNGIRFSDIAGGYELNVEDMKSFIRAWYQKDDLVCIWEKPEEGRGSETATYKASDLVEGMTPESMNKMVIGPDNKHYDVYFNVCPVKKPINSTKERAKENDAARMPGVWIDLDVKEGSFESKEDILEFLELLPLKPSIIVDSGNGIHSYTRFVETDVKPDRELSDAWQNYVKERAGDKSVDSTSDLARVLRTAGSMHTGKGSGFYSSVRLLKVSRTAYPVQVVRQVVRDSTERLRASKAATRLRENNLTLRTAQLSQGGRFAELLIKATHEDIINERFDWSDILEPHGWTLNRKLGDGSREWTRPGAGEGASPRSATTDHDGSNVMALHSDAEETLMQDLKGIVYITKTRALLRIWFNDDIDQMFEYLYKLLTESK